MYAVSVDAARTTQTFLRLAEIDSPSLKEGALATFLTTELQRLGWEVRNDGTGPDTGNLIARLPGNAERPGIMFSTHLDVVPPCIGVKPLQRDDWIETDGSTVLGADAKAGLAALLEVAQVLHDEEARIEHGPIEYVLTWGEEVGHRGAKALDRSQVAARQGFVLDALMPVGQIVVGGPGQNYLSVQVTGRSAHAGVEPERGISAIVVAAQAIAQLPWGRLDAETTANIGLISGGSARNAVPERVQLEGEARSLNQATLNAHCRRVVEVFEATAAAAGASAIVTVTPSYAGYQLAEDDPVVGRARRAFEAIGGTATLGVTGGGSDANEFNALDLPSCVLGIGAEGCHSVRERIAVSELVRLAEWTLAIVQTE